MINTTKTMNRTWRFPSLSLKAQTMAAVVAIVAAVALPQFVHTLGSAIGSGSALGELLLPMHLPIMLVGLLAGPYAGFIAGVIAPMISFVLTGMPGEAMLPFITIEVAIYGLSMGLMRNHSVNIFVKVFVAQIMGRSVRAVVILTSVYLLGNTVIKPAVILTSIQTGWVGILLQWALIAVVAYWAKKAAAHE